MACVCFAYVCDVRHLDKRVWICFWRVSGETTDKGTPSPFWGRATVRLPPSKFFLFFQANFLFFSTLPHNIIYSPILFVSERFSLLLCVFPYPCIFPCLCGEKYGYFYPIYSLVCFVVDYSCVFSFVLLSVLCSCIIFCCGCCVFR